MSISGYSVVALADVESVDDERDEVDEEPDKHGSAGVLPGRGRRPLRFISL